MKRKAWALFTYGLAIILLFIVLLVRGPDELLAAAFLLIVNLASLLLLLSRERQWDWSHWLGLCYLVLTAPFIILFLAAKHTGVSYLYGATLILASFVLFIVELLISWRTSALNRLLARFHDDEEPAAEREEEGELVVEQIRGRRERRFLARKGATVYHRNGCIALRRVPKEELLDISEGEAKAYGLTPCRACKPSKE
jgi:hypothetical protein